MKVIYHPRFSWTRNGHFPGDDHIEHPRRLAAVNQSLRELFSEDDLIQAKPSFKAQNALEATHYGRYIEDIEERCKELTDRIDLKDEGETASLDDAIETRLSRKSYKVATLAVGAAIQAADIAQKGGKAFALVRPPGHHAHRDSGHGFCLFNNVAIAAEYLARIDNVNRILIIDIDIHFGDGTYEICSNSDNSNRLYYLSFNQENLFPHPDVSQETINSTNIFLPKDTSDRSYNRALDGHIYKTIKKFKPNIIAVSAGFDTCRYDSEAYSETLGVGFSLTEDSYSHFKKILDRTNLPYFLVLEGGYHPTSIEIGLRVFAEK